MACPPTQGLFIFENNFKGPMDSQYIFLSVSKCNLSVLIASVAPSEKLKIVHPCS